MTTPAKLLDIRDLRVSFHGEGNPVEAVKGISFDLTEGETLAIVGESGSGKSVTCMGLTRLLPAPPKCQLSGDIQLNGRDILGLSSRELRKIRGKEVSYIFQEPSSSLNPVFTIGSQIAEVIKLHLPEVKNVRERVVEYLDLVGIRNPEQRYKAYPHELSGGMQQRVMIAMALACEPRLLIADEPTTALDVTIQAQIMDLLRDVRKRLNMSIILITHNFGIVNGFADKVMVMYRGEVVETGPTDEILQKPQHPYTQALLRCIPRLGSDVERLETIDHDKIASYGMK